MSTDLFEQPPQPKRDAEAPTSALVCTQQQRISRASQPGGSRALSQAHKPQTPESQPPEPLAQQIRRARKQQQLTLKQLSTLCGIAVSTLSKIENDQLSPSFNLLQALVQALDLEPTQLFKPAQPDSNRAANQQLLSRRVLTRRGQGQSVESHCYAHRLLATELSQKKLLPFTTRVRARGLAELEGWIRHPGEKFILVLSGTVELHCEHYLPARLENGDSCYLDSGMGHALISTSDQDADVLWVCSQD